MGSAVNDAWWWVALIYVFLMLPVFLFFAYFSASLTREAVEAVKPHKLTVDDSGLKVSVYEIENPADSETDIKGEKDFTVYRDLPDGVLRLSGSYSIPGDDIAGLRSEGKWSVLELKSDRKRFFLIPSAAVVKTKSKSCFSRTRPKTYHIAIIKKQCIFAQVNRLWIILINNLQKIRMLPCRSPALPISPLHNRPLSVEAVILCFW